MVRKKHTKNTHENTNLELGLNTASCREVSSANLEQPPNMCPTFYTQEKKSETTLNKYLLTRKDRKMYIRN